MSEVTTPAATDPNKTLGIVALVLSIVASIVGAIVGIVAYTKSKKEGHKNKFALAAIIVGFVLFVIQVISIILIVVASLAVVSSMCDGMEPGVYETTTGTSVTCP